MQTSIPEKSLRDYVCTQVNTLFPDGNPISSIDLEKAVAEALMRLEYCFQKIRVRRYCLDGQAKFGHLYSDHYLMFLWFLSNSLWRGNGRSDAYNKIYLLNKCLHGFDCAFDTALPDIFIVIHGVGTVLGKASYSNFLAVYHGCTVGQTQGIYPRLGIGVGIGAGAAIIGRSGVGDFSSVGAGCAVLNTDIAANTSVLQGSDGKLAIRGGHVAAIAKEYFLDEFLYAATYSNGNTTDLRQT